MLHFDLYLSTRKMYLQNVNFSATQLLTTNKGTTSSQTCFQKPKSHRIIIGTLSEHNRAILINAAIKLGHNVI